MSHAILSPSAAHRWLECTPSARLTENFPDTTSEYAEQGRMAHEVCELYGKSYFTIMPKRTFSAALKKLKANTRFEPEMEQTANIYLDHLKELAATFSKTPFAAFEVRVDVTEYVPDGFGTCDCLFIGDGKLVISDYKHGKGVAVFPENNPQLMLYALGALNTYNPIYGDSIKTVSIYIDQPRVNFYGGWEISVEELKAWGESIKPLAQAAFMGLGEYKPGEHCKFCPAKGECRARAEVNSAYADFVDADKPKVINPLLSNVEIGELLKSVKMIEDWCGALKDCALVKALNGEDIPGWKPVEGRKGDRKFDDVDAVFELLKEKGYEEAALYNRNPKTLTQICELMGKQTFDEILSEHITQAQGKPTLVPESDKKERWNSAVNDFKNLDDKGE